MGYIYKITNSINGKLYIGQTRKTIEERFQAHLKNAQKHINRYLYDAMNKSLNFISGNWTIFINGGDVFFDKDTLDKVEGYISHAHGLRNLSILPRCNLCALCSVRRRG